MKLNLFKLFILLVWPFATASAADVNTLVVLRLADRSIDARHERILVRP